MAHDLQILVNTPDQLTVINPPVLFNWFYGIIFALSLLFAAFLSWKTFRTPRRWLGNGMAIALIAVELFAWSNLRVTYKLTIDNKNNVLVYETLSNERDVAHSVQLNLTSIKHADMDFDRSRRRIVLTLNDNQLVFPLGDYDYEDSQFEVLELIRQHIGTEAENVRPYKEQ